MKAEQFYQSNAKAIPLIVMSEAQFLEQDKSASKDASAFKYQQFKGKPGQIAIINDTQGEIEKIYIGVDVALDAKVLAQAVMKLPSAAYALNQEVPVEVYTVWALAQYRFERYKKKQETETKILYLPDAHQKAVLAYANAIFLVRDLINSPTNDMGPVELAETLSKIAKTFKATFSQCVGKALLKKNYPAIHAVGRASEAEPRLLSLSWGNSNHPKVALVGKGVCFDTGGLDLKPASNMRLMKKDMGGAAQVIGLAQWIMAMNLPVYLQVWIPAVENAVSSNAYRPGDVITMRDGTTVEIDNTDAEGRLVLADAMVRACEDKPDLLIDFATLTGAARVAVGTELSAMFANRDEMAQALEVMGEKANDPVCRLPLYQAYKSMLESSIADLVNSPASSYAGAITAALFLQHFVPEGQDWLHFDVMAWNVSNKPGKPEGGEAMGICAVAKYLEARFL